MNAYGVYTLVAGKFERNLVTKYYHNCLARIHELSEAGKDCIIVSGLQGDLVRNLTGKEEHITKEVLIYGN